MVGNVKQVKIKKLYRNISIQAPVIRAEQTQSHQVSLNLKK